MSVKIAINGFGRIGRCVLRAILLSDKDIDVVAINDLTDPATLAHLLKNDSVHGRLPFAVEHDAESLSVAGRTIRVYAEKDPAALPWGELGIDVVVESTGIFRKRAQAQKHLDAGAARVIISAPATDPDITIVIGVNDDKYDRDQHKIISNASCTTNCLAPVVKVIQDNFGIVKGMMTTVHSYTNDQKILDLPHSDLRRARAAAMSMIPTTTGAAKALGLVIPELAGKFEGLAIRVPTPNVSLIDLTLTIPQDISVEEVNAAMKKAAENELVGILAYETEELVSTDFNGNSCSSIFDSDLTRVVDGNMLKVFSWYDNEWGYSSRVVDLVSIVG
ncbi:MAG: type I glyceraldehyde-3-phosphate dehydrogenase [Desulfuromonas sp.]|nr:MAG: type I glyceraldehyde-3-phosphate dehydrogenase [Desulfuromonas sp.]